MNKPNFICGAYNVSPEHPSDWSVKPIIIENVKTTIGGVLVSDVLARKYEYSLNWEAMNKSDYENLEELVNEHIATGVAVEFSYEKFPSASSAVDCHVRMSARNFKGGSGSTEFWSKVELTITEIANRL